MITEVELGIANVLLGLILFYLIKRISPTKAKNKIIKDRALLTITGLTVAWLLSLNIVSSICLVGGILTPTIKRIKFNVKTKN